MCVCVIHMNAGPALLERRVKVNVSGMKNNLYPAPPRTLSSLHSNTKQPHRPRAISSCARLPEQNLRNPRLTELTSKTPKWNTVANLMPALRSQTQLRVREASLWRSPGVVYVCITDAGKQSSQVYRCWSKLRSLKSHWRKLGAIKKSQGGTLGEPGQGTLAKASWGSGEMA